MNFKKILLTLVFALSVLTISAHAKTMQFTMGDYDAKVDSGEIEVRTMEVAPYTVEGRTMVPVRIIGETFGADVQYIHEEKKVVITLGDKKISMIIGEGVADVNGESVTLDVPSVETNGRTLVPLRFVSETLGFDVKYVAVTEQILITDDTEVINVNDAKIYPADFAAAYDMYFTEYGEAYGENEILATTKVMLSDYALYEAESNKWDIPYPFDVKEDIVAAVAELDALYPGHLDGVWANLLEIECRATDLNNFLYQVYLPDEETAEKHKAEKLGDYMAAKHILVSDEALAKQILSELKNGADFDALMMEYTEDPGVQTEPDGYVFTTGEMVEEFENAVKDLKIGSLSGVVKSPNGYHIIKRLEIPQAFVINSCANEFIANHFTDVIEKGNVKVDAYTDAQLLEMCK